jgi:hypothetical protein
MILCPPTRFAPGTIVQQKMSKLRMPNLYIELTAIYVIILKLVTLIEMF